MPEITVTEYSKLSGTKAGTLRQRIKRGSLQSVKKGKRLFIVLSDDEYAKLVHNHVPEKSNTSNELKDTLVSYNRLLLSEKDTLIAELRNQINRLETLVTRLENKLDEKDALISMVINDSRPKQIGQPWWRFGLRKKK